MIVLERIREGDWKAVDRMRETLERLVPDAGGQTISLRVGAGVWTWPGGQPGSSPTTVPHGLGRKPVLCAAFNNQDSGALEAITGQAFNYTDTSFDTRGMFKTFTPAAGGTTSFVWVVIG